MILVLEKLLYMHTLEKSDNERTVIALNNSFNALTKYYGQGKVEDVNNDYGVGYGFDLLCHADYGETLISVKSPSLIYLITPPIDLFLNSSILLSINK